MLINEGRHKLTEPHLSRLRELVSEHGERRLAKRFQMNAMTIMRALAGLPLRKCTHFTLTALLSSKEQVAP